MRRKRHSESTPPKTDVKRGRGLIAKQKMLEHYEERKLYEFLK